MGVNLVPGVPDEPVFAEIERQVQGETKLDDAQVTGEMRRANAQDPHQLIPHFLSELVKLRLRKLVKIGGRMNSGQNLAHLIVSFRG